MINFPKWLKVYSFHKLDEVQGLTHYKVETSLGSYEFGVRNPEEFEAYLRKIMESYEIHFDTE